MEWMGQRQEMEGKTNGGRAAFKVFHLTNAQFVDSSVL
jgi:hypothetical protein